MGNFHDDLKSDEIDDALLDIVLVGKHPEVDDLSSKVNAMVRESNPEANMRIREAFIVICNILHHLH